MLPTRSRYPASNGLVVRKFTNLEDCRELREQINDVNMRSAQPCAFSTYEFLQSAVAGDEFAPDGSNPEVFLLVAIDGDRVAGYLPLKRSQDRPLGLPRYRLGWLIIHDGNLPHLIATPESEAQCATAFVEYLGSCRRRDWTALEFAGQDDTSILRRTVRELPAHKYHSRLFPGNPTCAIPVKWDSLNDYFKELPERRSIGQYVRKLLKERTAEWIRSTDAASGLALFDVYLAVERRSWKHGTSAAIARSAKRLAFYRSLFSDTAPTFARVGVLTIDGIPVAAEITYILNRVSYSLEVAFDEQSSAGAPGRAQKLLAMYDCIRDGVQSYDLRWLFPTYKERWLARTTTTENIQVFRRGSVHHLKSVLGDLKRRLNASAVQQVDHNPSATPLSKGSGPPATPQESADALERSLASGITVERLTDAEIRTILPMRT